MLWYVVIFLAAIMLGLIGCNRREPQRTKIPPRRALHTQSGGMNH